MGAASRLVFAGERRVWLWAAALGLPLALVTAVWCLVPRGYYTGTNSTNALTLTAPISPGTETCARGLNIPAGTARIQLELGTGGRTLPALTMRLRLGARLITATVPPARGPWPTFGRVVFDIPRRPARPASVPASLCLQASGLVGWAILTTTESVEPPITIGGRAQGEQRLALWYLPPRGMKRSYLDEAGAIFDRAALFAPGAARPWLFAFVVFALLPVLALLAVRCLALSVAGTGRRLALAIYAIAAMNAAVWSIVTPIFQAPDEVDHFAYVQSVVERGHSPSPYTQARLARWSSAENGIYVGSRAVTDHQLPDTRAPWLRADRRAADRLLRGQGGRRGDGGGYEGAAGYGPVYYLGVAPGYVVARGSSTIDQLALTRLLSAALGALAALFAYLAVRELAPGRPWLGVLAGLLVAFQPMYGFISGTVNNDVGVDAGGAALLYLLVRLVRRGLEWRVAAAAGIVLGLLPAVKGSGYDFYPVAAVALALVLVRGGALRNVRDRAILTAVAALVSAGCAAFLLGHFLTLGLRPAAPASGAGAAVATASGTIANALKAPASFITYVWEVFFPPVLGMTPHFPPSAYPAHQIFVVSGFGAFGWNDILHPGWVYSVIGWSIVVAGALGLLAIRREWQFVRRRWRELAVVVLVPVVVIAGVEAVFYTTSRRALITEFGRYEFPAIAAYAALVVAALHGFGRRLAPVAGTLLLVAMLALSYASQLRVLTQFFG